MNDADYPGDYYAPIGNFLREQYLAYNFTKGTVAEVDFLVKLFDLPKGASILDVGCGVGRHSLELARRGYHTLGIDISIGFIDVARKSATTEGLPAEFHVVDARDMTFVRKFDAAICLCEGAFGLAGSDRAHKSILTNVYLALKPGALFVLTAINALSAARHKTENETFDAYTCTSVSHEVIQNAAGETREVNFYTTCFTYRELKWLLEEAGFTIEAGYGCTAGAFQRKPLNTDDIEIMMVARRNH